MLALAALPACESSPPRPRHLVFVVLDTVRSDHLPLYGYERDTAPRITAFARERGVVFDHAFSQQTNTGPSHASMFTGRYPPQHGARFNGQRLPPGSPTLAEILAAAGFRTGGFVSAAPMKARACGLGRGFEVWDDDFPGRRRNGRETLRRALAWLGERNDEPTFLFVHLYDAHGPYEPEPEYARLFDRGDTGPPLPRIPRYQRLQRADGTPLRSLEGYVDRYDAMIRTLDDLVAELLSAVDPERSVVVLLADHGETLGERYHVLDHGGQLFEEQLRIPLVLAAPSLPATRVEAPAETVDLLPTLLELLGVSAPEGATWAGSSLLPRISGTGAGPKSRLYAMARAMSARHADRGYELRKRANLASVRDDRWKLIAYPGVGGPLVELYDLSEDPAERRDVAAEHPELVEARLSELQGWMLGAESPGAEPLPSDLLDQLRELGYVDE